MYLVRPSWLIKSIYPQAIWRKDVSESYIYLTFDDGPIPEITTWVLDVLKKRGVPATFFCVGENIAKHPDIFQRIKAEQHQIGNHTYHHINGWSAHTVDYIEDVKLCDASISDKASTKLFRPPYGKMKKSQLQQVSKDYAVVMWDVLSGDYDRLTSPEKCLNNVCTAVRNGSIIVFHDNIKAKKNLEYSLPRFIDYALSKGFVFKCL